MVYKKKIDTLSLQFPTDKLYQANLDRLLLMIEQHKDKELIVAPEVCLTAYDYEHIDSAAEFSQKALDILQEVVGDQIVVVTLILKTENGFVNRAVVINKHTIVHSQEKAKLFRLGDEDRYLIAGDISKIKPFEIDGVKYALLICFELRFKELWSQIEGADVIIIPSRWGLLRKSHLEILSRALAVINQCFVILSNSSDSDMASSSSIISPDGKATQNDKSSAIEGVLDLAQIKKMRRYIVID